jgi:hypothetical protein
VKTKSILTIIEEKLNVFGIQPSTNQNFEAPNRLLDGLRKANKFVLLICDEFDCMYQVDSLIMEQNLAELNFLGNNNMGRIATFLCSSSAWLEPLIYAAKVPARYKLMGRDLNGTKFKTRRVKTTLLTDLDNIKIIVGGSDTSRHRALLFTCGGSARFIEQANSYLWEEIDVLFAKETSMLDTQFEILSDDDMLFFRQIMKKLWRMNYKNLFRKVLKPEAQCALLFKNIFKIFSQDPQMTTDLCELDVDKLVKFAWENIFIPLARMDLEKIWSKYYKGDCNHEELNNVIRRLCDRNKIVFDDVQQNRPEYIYPVTMLDLVESHSKTEVMEQLKRFLSEPQSG